jgi:hypothetical protein
MINLFESRTILFKKEVTEGVDPTPTGAANALLSFDGSVSIDSEVLERNPDRAYFGGDPFKLVGRKITIETTIELLGNATAGLQAPCGPLLECCGHASALVASTSDEYSPITTSVPSGTFYFYHAGLFYKAKGCRGNADIEIMVKGYAKARLRFIGVVTSADLPTEAAAPAVTLTAWRDPPVVETETLSVTIGGVAFECTKLTLAQNNDLQIHEHSEARRVLIMDRKPALVITGYLPALASLNPWNLANTHADNNVIAIVDGGATKKLTLTSALTQFKYPKPVELQRGYGLEIEGVSKPSAAGGDEYKLKFE